MDDLVAIGLACCYMIAGCERVRDYDRAVQWCARLKVFCAKWGLRPLFAVCRTQYASICMWRGTWLEAEQELTRRDRRARGQPSGDDGRRARPPRRAAAAAGTPRRSRRALRAGRCRIRLALARPGRAGARSRRSRAPRPSSPRATFAACRRTIGPIAPPASSSSSARSRGRATSTARARRSPSCRDRALVETLPLRGDGEPSRRVGRRSAAATPDAARRASRGRGRSLPPERRAVRAGPRAASSWRARWRAVGPDRRRAARGAPRRRSAGRAEGRVRHGTGARGSWTACRPRPAPAGRRRPPA